MDDLDLGEAASKGRARGDSLDSLGSSSSGLHSSGSSDCDGSCFGMCQCSLSSDEDVEMDENWEMC